jgi:hypothetical protein
VSYITLADLRRLYPDLPELPDEDMTAALDEAILRLGYTPVPEVTAQIAKLAAEYLMGKRQMG